MGVYIKGITLEMLRNASLEAVEELLASGDMVEVKEPHGRLIDADDLFKGYDEQRNKYPVKSSSETMMIYEIFDEIDDTPTVIESEE